MLTKLILTFFIACVTTTEMKAQNQYDAYYQNLPQGMTMPQVATPTIPDNKVCLTDVGGKGDGLTSNTAAFEKGISRLAKLGGGHLVVPAGVYLTGLISLKDCIDLHLERGAVIVFSPNKQDHYKDPASIGQGGKPSSCITASKRHDVSITGEGIIDGNGEWWRAVKRSKVSDVEWKQFLSMGGTVTEKGDLWYPFDLKHMPNVADNMQLQERLRQNMVRMTDCQRVLVQGVTLMNSPKFHLTPQRCTDVIIDGVTVRCPWNAQNGDAIDIGNCRNVLIVRCTIDCGDDGICMKGGVGKTGEEYGPCENINIQDNTVYHAHGGFVIGSEFSGGMKNIFVHRNTFAGTDTGLRFKSGVGRGGITENIIISDIMMTDIRDEAVVFETTYANNPVGEKETTAKATNSTFSHDDYAPNFQDIHISDVVCRGCHTAVRISGPKSMIHDITVERSNFFYTHRPVVFDAGAVEGNVTLTDVKFVSF